LNGLPAEMFENTERGICFNFYGISGTLATSVRAEQVINEFYSVTRKIAQ